MSGGIVDKRLPGRAWDDKARGLQREVVGGRRAAHERGARPGLITYNNLPFEATTASTNLLPENFHRLYLNIQNQGAVNIYVSFGGKTGGMIITPGLGFEWNINAPQNTVYVYTTAGTSDCILIEGTRS